LIKNNFKIQISLYSNVNFSSRGISISKPNNGTSALPNRHGIAYFILEHTCPLYWKNCQVHIVILDILSHFLILFSIFYLLFLFILFYY